MTTFERIFDFFPLHTHSAIEYKDPTTNITTVNITCVTSPLKGDLKKMPTKVKVSGVTPSKDDAVFTYLPDPEITGLSRNKSMRRYVRVLTNDQTSVALLPKNYFNVQSQPRLCVAKFSYLRAYSHQAKVGAHAQNYKQKRSKNK